MTNAKQQSKEVAARRRSAEKAVQESGIHPPEQIDTLLPEEIRMTFHELSVHQMELEMQNEELRRIQAELDDARARYFDLYDLAPVGYCTLSDQGLILEANLTACNLLGTNRGQLTNQHFFRFIIEEDRNISPFIHRQGNGSWEPHECEVRMVKEDGSVFWAHLVITNSASDIRSRQCRVVLTDITARKQAEEELVKMQNLESLSLLAGTLGHNFNNILMVILGNILFAKTLLSPDDAAYERLATAETATMQAKDLTQQFLTFAKDGTPAKKSISVADILRNHGRLALSGAQSTCEYFLPDDLWPIEADESQIGQVIINLLLNADQSMPEGGPIKVHCENVRIDKKQNQPLKDGRYVKISIVDQGLGIPNEHRNKIFDPYFTTKLKGRGLGLASAYSILKKHGGHIEVDSTTGSGTTFTLFLPASAVPLTPVAPPVAGKEQEPLQHQETGRILIMDDDDMVREIVATALKAKGYGVEHARDGEEAVKKYTDARRSNHPFDAVIMDLIVPGGMGGEEATRKLLHLDPDAKVIVSSGYCKGPIWQDYQKFGFSGAITKPFSFKELTEQLRRVLQA
jgi:two-component system, cell cycle sensor histidine kinase and response regulator CckA